MITRQAALQSAESRVFNLQAQRTLPGIPVAEGDDMKTRQNSGFTFLEVLLIVMVVFVVMGLLLPSMHRAPRRSNRIQCVSNLKQIVLAFRMWSNDRGEKFPMQLSEAEGGTKGLISQGLPLSSLMIISNELNSPKLLTCQDDKGRKRVSLFTELTPNNLSYFVGVDAAETNPASILSGDRNIHINGKPARGYVRITDYSTATWGPDIHKHHGNIALADGSASQTTQDGLQKAIRGTGLATNRFAIP